MPLHPTSTDQSSHKWGQNVEPFYITTIAVPVRVYDLEEMTSAKHNFQVMSISSCLHFQQGDNESLSNAEGI